MAITNFVNTRRGAIAAGTTLAIAAGVALAGAPAMAGTDTASAAGIPDTTVSNVMFEDEPVGVLYSSLSDAGVMPTTPLPTPAEAPRADFDHMYGLDSDALAAGQMVAGIWGITNIGGYSTGGHVAGSDHYTGNALDIMLTPVNDANIELGWEIAHWLEDHAEELNIYYIIWNGKIWKAYDQEAGWTQYSHPWGGTSYEYAHHDHIHVSFY